MSGSAQRTGLLVNARKTARMPGARWLRMRPMNQRYLPGSGLSTVGPFSPRPAIQRVASRSTRGQRFEQVAPADDPHRLEVIVDDRNAGNAPGEQQVHRLGDG